MPNNRSISIAAMMLVALLMAACEQETITKTVEVPTEASHSETEIVVTEAPSMTVTPAVAVEPPVAVEEPTEAMPVILGAYSLTTFETLDPQLVEDKIAFSLVENLFVNLTNYDLETSEILPEAAMSWEISEDGLIYTFNLRPDIPWVKHNPVTGETTQVVDDAGNPRFVTAMDFAYAIKRVCDPANGSYYYSSVLAPQILGCNDVLAYEDGDDIPQDLIDVIGVSATNEVTLVIKLESPASYFLSLTPLWLMAASPQWVIEEEGERWTEAGNITTNGRFTLNEWTHNMRHTLVRNPLFPEDLQGSGNIEKIVVTIEPDINTVYTRWLNNEIEYAEIPEAELGTHLDQYGAETVQIPHPSVFYIAFRQTKPPFDNVHVRRAFSAAFDRAAFVRQILDGQGLPMSHLAPPGIFGAPPINEVGIGYDPRYAAAQLVEAGYPNCEGFPAVTLLGYDNQSTLDWIEFARTSWSENLGCSPDLIQIEQLPFTELLAVTHDDVFDEEAPHMWTLGWRSDYADENNWVGDVLGCENNPRLKRTCNEIDELIVEARFASDPDYRRNLYRTIEEAFFGPDGEYPLFPIWLRIAFVAEHSWLDRVPALLGGEQWYNWTIDQTSKLAAQGR